MEISGTATIRPYFISAALTITEEDIRKAFFRQEDPNEDLWYALTSEAWDEKPVSEKLRLLAEAAKLVEGTQAARMSIVFGPPEVK